MDNIINKFARRIFYRIDEYRDNYPASIYILPVLVFIIITLTNYFEPIFRDTLIFQYGALIVLTAWYTGMVSSLILIVVSVAVNDILFADQNYILHHDISLLLVFIPATVIIGYLVNSQKQALALANRLALYDNLTGLANRRLLEEKLSIIMEMALRGNNKFGLIYIDIDNFKSINDTFGHLVGDAVLGHTAHNLKSGARSEDIVSRYGGDEFLIILNNLDSNDEAVQIAERIASSFITEFEYLGTKISLSISMGIAVFPEHGMTFHELLNNADRALYSAKKIANISYAIS